MPNHPGGPSKWQEGDVVEITEEYSSYGANEQITKYRAVLTMTDKGLKLYVDGKPFVRGVNSLYKLKLLEQLKSNGVVR